MEIYTPKLYMNVIIIIINYRFLIIINIQCICSILPNKRPKKKKKSNSCSCYIKPQSSYKPSIFLSSVPPVILKLDEPEKRHHTCIEFTVRGFPHPTLRWFHKDREILQSEYIRTEMEYYQDYLEGCLIFQNPTHYDNGYYTLIAANSLGSVTKTVHGFFLDPPFSEDDGTSEQCNLSFIMRYEYLF